MADSEFPCCEHCEHLDDLDDATEPDSHMDPCEQCMPDAYEDYLNG